MIRPVECAQMGHVREVMRYCRDATIGKRVTEPLRTELQLVRLALYQQLRQDFQAGNNDRYLMWVRDAEPLSDTAVEFLNRLAVLVGRAQKPEEVLGRLAAHS